MGENVTTVGIDLLGLGRGTWLRFVGDSDGEESGDGKCEKAFLDVLVHATFFAIIIAGLVMRADSKYVVAAIIAHIFTILLCIALLRSIQSELGVAVVEITGVRQPCRKIDEFRKWLKEKCFVKNGKMIVARKAGIMGVVESGGVIRPGMRIVVEPAEDFQELKGLP